MPLILPGNVGSATAATGYNVANSLRFNSGSSDRLNKTLGTPTNNLKWTYSFWIKRSKLGEEVAITESINNSQNKGIILFRSDDQLEILDLISDSYVMQKKTNRKFRDVSAWYHIVFSNDSTVGSPDLKIYVNGVEETSLATDNEYSQNQAGSFNSALANHIGASASSRFSNCYFSEFVFIDGQALAADQFGEFDSDSPTIWKPKNVSGLTFGDNGFYFEFKQSGTGTDANGMGADTSGNTNHFAVNNLTAVDQSTDTCTNNFATMNSIDNLAAGSTFSEGNLKIVTTNGNITYNTSTIGFSSGKWYMETKLAGSAGYTVGVVRGVSTANDNGNKLGNRADGFSYDDGGIVENNGGTVSGTSGYNTYSSGDIIGVYADLDNNKLYFSKDGSLQSSTGIDITAGTYFFAVGDNNASNSSTYEVNFGGTNTYSVSSGNTDGTYGNFEYSTTITGDSASKTFKALNTKNLAEFG